MPQNELTWESMTPVQRNHWIAVHVMGWTPPIYPNDPVPPFPVEGDWDYHNPPTEVEEWRANYRWRCPQNGGCWREPVDYVSTASGDYNVLQFVRSHWHRTGFGQPSMTWFTTRLSIIWQNRCRVGENVLEQYQPGDYSHAAFLAFTE